VIHIFLHFLVPAFVAGGFFRRYWVHAYLLMIATMVVDLDHLLASPIYDPNRCSIGFHPLHQPELVLLYLLLCIPAKTRLIGLGLCIHMLLDAVDCQLTSGLWIS
jgi:hypothetical protein